MKFKNLTPHTVSILLASGEKVTFPSEGNVRVSMNTTDPLEVGGLPTGVTTYGETVGLPNPSEGVGLIVSTICKEAAMRSDPSRRDLFVPDSGPDAVRENGQIVAVRRLLRVA